MRRAKSFPRSSRRGRRTSRTRSNHLAPSFRDRTMTERSIPRVLLWMLGALLSFSTMAVSIRVLGGTLSVLEILTIRSAAGVVVLLTIAAANPRLRAQLVPRRMGLHAVRNLAHFAAQYAWARGI